MRKLPLFLLLFAFSNPGTAQNKLFTMEDAVLRQRNVLAPKNLKQLTWIKNSVLYAYVDKDRLLIVNAENGKNTHTVTLEDINTGLRKIKADTLAGFPFVSWNNSSSFTLPVLGKTYEYQLPTKQLSTADRPALPDKAENMDESSKSHSVAYTLKNNLFVRYGNRDLQVTADADENIVNGKSVHREEFGIFKGTFWSPGGNLLAWYRMDQRMVSDYPIVDFSVVPASNSNIKYPMAGDTSHEVTIGIYDVKKERSVFLKTGGAKDHYLTNIAWSPDESTVYVAELNREQDHMLLNSYNAVTGEFIKTLFEEKDQKYVQPMHPLEFVDKEHFTWQSERDGHDHLYLYDIQGKLLKQLTKGNWEVLETKGLSKKGDRLFFTASAEGPLNKDLYSVNLNSGKTERLTAGSGTHTVMLNDSREYAIDNFSSLSVPREISIVQTAGGKKNVILTAENPLKEYKTSKVDVFTIKAEDNTLLYCRMIKPVDFDSTKKYPVVVYLYGGPNVQLITNSWLGGSELWYQYMAQKGFIVFTLDSRGSEGRGKDFEQATFKQLGTVEMNDQLTGVKYLASLSYVDKNRMGVHGWSFGGFITTSLMTRHPGIFKAGVAGGPVIDWSYYEVMYTERYMDTPQTNKKGYDDSSLLNHAQDLKGKLLMIHGGSDNVVVWQHSLDFVKKCVDKGVQLDYFVYPGHLHNVLGKDRVHLMNKVCDYFILHL